MICKPITYELQEMPMFLSKLSTKFSKDFQSVWEEREPIDVSQNEIARSEHKHFSNI